MQHQSTWEILLGEAARTAPSAVGKAPPGITQSRNEDGAGYRDRKLEQRMVRPKPIKDRL